jgi:hypothetical protein
VATILETIQNFCYRINVPAPAAVVGVSSPTEQQYLSIFTFIGDNLRNRPYQWPQLKRGYRFFTETDVRRYQLPGDFYRILESGQWDLTNNWPLRGPISDYNFDIREFAVVSLQTRKAFRLIGPTNYLYSTTPWAQRSQGYFEIDPAGQNDDDELFLGYVSCNWIWPRDWVANTAYSLGDIRSGNGYVYRCTGAGTSGTTRPSWPTGSDVDGTVTWTVYLEPYQSLSSNAALNDNDICLFDMDLMIEGMRWAFFRAKKQEYEQERQDWENQLKSAYSRFDGPIRLNLGDTVDDYFDEFPIGPTGSWTL